MDAYDNYSESPPMSTVSTAEGKENECIALAYDLVRKRLIEGTATSAETVHFLKLGTAKERLEMEKTKKELELMDAKKEALQSAKHIEELYNNAISAMREYAYLGMDDDEEFGDEPY